MSIKIKDVSEAKDYCRIASRPMERIVTVIVLDAIEHQHPTRADVPRDEFLAAVETECGVRMVPVDAIVIDRAELPGIDLTSDGAPWSLGQTTQSAEKGRAVGLAFLALAEYLTAHPPVPPVSDADTETLAGLLREHDFQSLADRITILPDGRIVTGASADIIARRLLATGRVSVTR